MQQENAKTLQRISDCRIKVLEQAHPGFAYDVLALEIDIEEDRQQVKSKKDSKIAKITRLMGLYMLAVEVLQGAADNRYIYFNKKIQSLMTKKHIVEQLHVASTGKKASKELLASTELAMVKERKGQMDLQLFFNKEQFDSKKVKEMLTSAENKFKKIQGNISKDIKKQDDKLEERIRLRKLRSDNGSVCKFKFNNTVSPNNGEVKDPRLEYFDDQKPQTKRKGSVEKKKLLKCTSQQLL